MRFFDLLGMSISNLWKRKLRTILTVLGVVIGITSIVVMVALGNGLKESMLESYESYGSMTEISVMSGSGYGGGDSSEEILLNDELINQFMNMEHVQNVKPILEFSAMAKSGIYMGYLEIQGVTDEYLKSLNLELKEGELPDSDKELKFIYGNSVLSNFYIEKTGSYPYWDKNEEPKINLSKDPIFIIFDTDAYYSSQNSSSSEGGEAVAPPKKYQIKTSGVMSGGIDDWNANSYRVYCNVDALKMQLKKVFKKKAIPGQPTRKNGKPYNELFYSRLIIEVDDMQNVEPLTKRLKDEGYNVESSLEWIQSSIDQMNTIQAVLGAIGAVAMLVAAISITNTMMMSIYERTKEIGVMKVLGCDIHNIQTLFLMEAGFIGFLGGIVGVIFSYGIGAIINKFFGGSLSDAMGVTGSICRIPLWLAPASVGFAVIIGMVAGFIPSLRAMKLSPLAAIRNE